MFFARFGIIYHVLISHVTVYAIKKQQQQSKKGGGGDSGSIEQHKSIYKYAIL